MTRYGDYPAARQSFVRAARYGRPCGARDLEMIAQCNLSDTYSMSGDTLGIDADREAYRYAMQSCDTAVAAASAFHCAAYYLGSPLRAAAPGAARPYIESLLALGDTSRYYQLMGLYYLGADSLSLAEPLLRQRVERYPDNANARLYYAWLLLKQESPQASLAQLAVADSLRGSKGTLTPPEADYLRYQALKLTGETAPAMAALERYAARRDSLSAARAGEDAARMRAVFAIDQAQSALALQEEKLRVRTWTFIAIIAALIVGAALYWLWRRRRRALYRAIVHLSAPAPAPAAPKAPPQSAALADDKAERIWSAIEREVRENRIYADPRTTRDSFAERVGVNHTWFSQVIKQRTGKSYLQYINSCRVQEALRQLGERAASGQVKGSSMAELSRSLGFMSTATFYKAFRAEVGITPAAYLATLTSITA